MRSPLSIMITTITVFRDVSPYSLV